MAVSGQRSAVRKIDHKLTVYGTEDNCLKRDLQDFCDFQDWGTCDNARRIWASTPQNRTTIIAVSSHQSERVGNRSSLLQKIAVESGIGVPSYKERSAVSKSRESEFPPTIAVSGQRSGRSRSGDRSYSPFYFFIEKTTKIGGFLLLWRSPFGCNCCLTILIYTF